MTTQTEALRLALDALIWTTGSADFSEGGTAREGALKILFPAIAACKEALAAPQSTGNILMDSYNQMVAMKEAAPHGDREPNNDEVICPNCTTQFRAIPVNVQKLMLDAGFEPPFTAAPQGEPVAWVTMWLERDGSKRPVFHPHSYKPKYGTPLDETLSIVPLFTHPAPAPLSGFKLLEITVAYEQGVGKGMKRDNFNPYKPGCDAARAWQLGYEEGEKKPSAPAPLTYSDGVNACLAILSKLHEAAKDSHNYYGHAALEIERHARGV